MKPLFAKVQVKQTEGKLSRFSLLLCCCAKSLILMSSFLSLIRNLAAVVVVPRGAPFGYNIFTIQFQCHKSRCPDPLDETPTTTSTTTTTTTKTMTMTRTTSREPGADVAEPAPRAAWPAPPDSCLQRRIRPARPILDGSVPRSRDIPSSIRQTWRWKGRQKRGKCSEWIRNMLLAF
jgi:hypothetical protein